MAKIGDKIELTEELFLAMSAGLWAIEKNHNYSEFAFPAIHECRVLDKEIHYPQAAKILRSVIYSE